MRSREVHVDMGVLGLFCCQLLFPADPTVQRHLAVEVVEVVSPREELGLVHD